MRYIGTGRPLDHGTSERSFAIIQSHWTRHGSGLRSAISREDGEYLGFVGLAVVPGRSVAGGDTEIGWRLRRAAWGKGFATEGAVAVRDQAFDALGITSLVSRSSPATPRIRPGWPRSSACAPTVMVGAHTASPSWFTASLRDLQRLGGELRGRAVARVHVDRPRLDDELARRCRRSRRRSASRRNVTRLRLARRRASPAGSRAGGGPAGRCSPPGRGCRAGRPRRPRASPVFFTSTLTSTTLPSGSSSSSSRRRFDDRERRVAQAVAERVERRAPAASRYFDVYLLCRVARPAGRARGCSRSAPGRRCAGR